MFAKKKSQLIQILTTLIHNSFATNPVVSSQEFGAKLVRHSSNSQKAALGEQIDNSVPNCQTSLYNNDTVSNISYNKKRKRKSDITIKTQSKKNNSLCYSYTNNLMTLLGVRIRQIFNSGNNYDGEYQLSPFKAPTAIKDESFTSEDNAEITSKIPIQRSYELAAKIPTDSSTIMKNSEVSFETIRLRTTDSLLVSPPKHSKTSSDNVKLLNLDLVGIDEQDTAFRTAFEDAIKLWNSLNSDIEREKNIKSGIANIMCVHPRIRAYEEVRSLKKDEVCRSSLTMKRTIQVLSVFLTILRNRLIEKNNALSIVWKSLMKLFIDTSKYKSLQEIEPCLTNFLIFFMDISWSVENLTVFADRIEQAITSNGRGHPEIVPKNSSIDDAKKYFDENITGTVSSVINIANNASIDPKNLSFKQTITHLNTILMSPEFRGEIESNVKARISRRPTFWKATNILINSFASYYFTIPFFRMYDEVFGLWDKDNGIHNKHLISLNKLFVEMERRIFEAFKGKLDRKFKNQMSVNAFRYANIKTAFLSPDFSDTLPYRIKSVMDEWCNQLEMSFDKALRNKQYVITNFITAASNIAQISRTLLLAILEKRNDERTYMTLYDNKVFECILFDSFDPKNVVVFSENFYYELFECGAKKRAHI